MIGKPPIWKKEANEDRRLFQIGVACGSRDHGLGFKEKSRNSIFIFNKFFCHMIETGEVKDCRKKVSLPHREENISTVFGPISDCFLANVLSLSLLSLLFENRIKC